MDFYYEQLMFGLQNGASFRQKHAVNFNRRTTSRMESTINRYKKERVKSCGRISRKQEEFLLRQCRVLPELHLKDDQASVHSSSCSQPGTPSTHRGVTLKKSPSRQMLTLIDVTKMRPNMTSATSCVRAFTAPPFTRRGRVTPERVQARRHWCMIRDNLKFLITKEKEEVNEIYNFGVIYNELLNCRYIRHTVKQEQELKRSSHNDICLCNACALKITKEITKKHKNRNRTKILLKGER
ncbi:uncharacterized protein LOC130654573 [Hydractinia symbiolongicarpus]|uniref:uncharacterized protein LOC130654573 n=1 Tax=Hydractinia symbiolongicarpus TaxID=13093 RepID=UPI0025516A67|nr:uncharacterized protein LOC130654573 [Hydractinia symbiolongicarpus]XP_057313166.1 uncharacterized protein LOC130654573 [Hydractinia symbiolongicarpus]XP_057313167.1 uncharacterized protein LOC130654573 [Hydractinia symbiolongicarpus]